MSVQRGVVAMVMLLALGGMAGSVGPPVRGPVKLTREQEGRLGALNAAIGKAAQAGEMGRALRLAQEVESLRRQWQGSRHWETIDARYAVERGARLARLSAAAQKEAARAQRHRSQAFSLYARGRYAEAEKAFRETLVINKKALGEEHPATAGSYGNLASCLQAQGKAAQAQPLHEKALAILKKALGEEYPDTARSYNYVAGCLQAQGKAAQAQPLHEKALAISKKALGEEHPDTARSYNYVAYCLQAQGKHREAQPLFEKALVICKKALGEEHPHTATSYNNLAYCLQAQGKAAQAQPLYEKALAISKKALGEEHPATATSYGNLAGCLQAQGKAALAQPLFEKALAIRKKALGEEHPDTARSYNYVAGCLQDQGKAALAQPLHEKALAILKKALGEEHPHTANSYNNLAYCLQAQGKAALAQPLFEKALAILKKALGEEHPHTATSYGNVAGCLQAQGKAALAQPLHEKALAILKKALGEEHPDTATSYNNVASCLQAQGKAALAQPLHEKALAISRKALGEEHPDTATSYNNVASCLQAQGKAALAQPLHEKALAISKKALGEEHPHTANSYNNLAYCLHAQGKAAQAQPLYEKALAISRKALGEEHPDTARGYNYVAGCLQDQGKAAQAQPLFEKALAIRKKALGEEHPHTANSYNNLAYCLHAQGKAAQALLLFEKALVICKKALGEEHPATAHGYNNLAYCLQAQGKHKEAIAQWQRALLGHDFGRLSRADTGFDRARAGANWLSPRAGLALAYAHLKQPEKAWHYAEADLARNLLDDLASAAPEDLAAREQLRKLDEQLLPLFGREKLTSDQQALRKELIGQRQAVLSQLAKRAAARSAAHVLSLAELQKRLPADGGLVLWVRTVQEHRACVVRAQGPPQWLPLVGTGKNGTWTGEDFTRPGQLEEALSDDKIQEMLANPRLSRADRQQLTETLRKQRELTEEVRKRWFAPLEKHLKADGKLPAVKRLFVVPSHSLAKLPLEVLAPGYTITYTPSATVLARALKDHRPLKPGPALALGDPVFRAPALAAPPKHGVLVASVQANSPADKAGLRKGDVLLRYDDAKLDSVNDLVAALKKNPKGKATYWRDGSQTTVALAMPLGITIDRRPAPEAVRAFREDNTSVTRGETFAPLPGTRAEVLALGRLLGKDCTTLLGSDASEQRLEAMTKDLKSFRVLHLATHGLVDLAHAERSRLILARDKLPSQDENLDRVLKGKRPINGELTVQAILEDWKLDADLVVLSACQTGLGHASQGDGLLGFSYALMRAGARSVVLSRWKVDDTATALLMLRFYENLMGKAKGLKKPMGRADALTEAKKWLRELPRAEATKLAAALIANKLAGTRGSVVDLDIKDRPKLPTGDRPYEHPFYWAAFTLVGDPD